MSAYPVTGLADWVRLFGVTAEAAPASPPASTQATQAATKMASRLRRRRGGDQVCESTIPPLELDASNLPHRSAGQPSPFPVKSRVATAVVTHMTKQGCD